MKTQYLAAYGTLKQGGAFWRRRSAQALNLQRYLRFESPCTLRGTLLDLTPTLGPWPGLIDGDSDVAAHLFAVTDQRAWPLLDAYEDVSSGLYTRRAVQVQKPNALAQTYIFTGPRAGARIIANGVWPPVSRRAASGS